MRRKPNPITPEQLDAALDLFIIKLEGKILTAIDDLNAAVDSLKGERDVVLTALGDLRTSVDTLTQEVADLKANGVDVASVEAAVQNINDVTTTLEAAAPAPTPAPPADTPPGDTPTP